MDKRIIVPALFGLLTLGVIGGYASLFLIIPLPLAVKIAVGAAVAALAAAMVYVIIQRSRELKEEDKDDLGKY